MRGPLEHGTRRMYRRCRCVQCRASNAAYEAARCADTTSRHELVSAAAVRQHLTTVHAQGVGIRQVARLAGVSPTVIQDLQSGRLTVIREATAQRLLAIPCVLAHGRCVPAWRTWRLVRLLIKEGFSPEDLATKLGLHTLRRRAPSTTLQRAYGRQRVRVKTALRVRLLYQRLTDEGPEGDEGASAT